MDTPEDALPDSRMVELDAKLLEVKRRKYTPHYNHDMAVFEQKIKGNTNS